MLKMTISTCFWGEQHPNDGRNIQRVLVHGCCLVVGGRAVLIMGGDGGAWGWMVMWVGG